MQARSDRRGIVSRWRASAVYTRAHSRLLCIVRLVVPRAAVTLDHAIYLLRPAETGVAIAARERAVTLLDSRCVRVAQMTASGTIEDVSWSQSARLAGIIDDVGLRMLEVHREHVRWRIAGTCYACHFTALGDALWVVRPSIHHPGAWIELRDVGNGGTLHKLHVPDVFGGSAFTLAPHTDPRSVVLWLSSPDAETQSIAVTANDHGLVAVSLPLHHGYPPEPIPDSDYYLLVRDAVLERRSWTDHQICEQMHWPWLDDEDLAVLPLSSRCSLWASRSGRLHLIDHMEMQYLEEIGVSVRPPRPLPEYFADAQDSRWGTDLSQFCVSADQLVLQFGEFELLTVPIASIIV